MVHSHLHNSDIILIINPQRMHEDYCSCFVCLSVTKLLLHTSFSSPTYSVIRLLMAFQIHVLCEFR